MYHTSYVLRRATFCDIPRIAHVTRCAWANTAPATSGGHHEDHERVHEDLMLGGGFVLELNDDIVGSVRWFPDTVANAWEVMRLGILPAYRGEDWGLALMNEVARGAD